MAYKMREENIVVFKNGNINIRLPKDRVQKARENIEYHDDWEEAFFALDSVMEDIDCEAFGEDFCINNYEMGTAYYSGYTDRMYILSHTDLWEVLCQGEMLKLKAIIPDEDDRREIDRDIYDIWDDEGENEAG